jgi:Flp pilus assembly protein TadD
VLPIVTEVAAEHRMYLSLAAVIAIVAVGVAIGGRAALARLVPGLRARRRVGAVAAAALIVIAVAGYGTMTRARNLDYSSAVRLWGDTVAKDPANQRARVAFGEALANAGHLAQAETAYRAAIDLAPTDATALARLGGVLAAEGRLDDAISFFERALAARPGDVDAERGLGLALATRREDVQAIGHLERALEMQPDDAVVAGQLATILADSRDESLRDGNRAVELAERAVQLTSSRDPTSLEILSVALASVERYADAAAAATEALTIARARGDRELAARLDYRANAYRAMAK